MYTNGLEEAAGGVGNWRNARDPRLRSLEEAQWNDLVGELGGQIHQSWGWGEFKSRFGWQVERFAIDCDAGAAAVQVLFRHRGPLSTAFVPRGPLVRGDVQTVLPALWKAMEDACRRHRAISITVEPSQDFPVSSFHSSRDHVAAPSRVTPKRSVVVPLLDDDSLIRNMHSAKRREIRKAERRGITIRDVEPGAPGMDSFHELLMDTARRNGIRCSSVGYYAGFLREFGDDAKLKLAVVDGKIAAGLIVGKFGNEATYLFGGSSTLERVPGATAYLQFSAMRWARENGCSHYDLWGIPDIEQPASYIGSDLKPLRSVEGSEIGLYRFKVEFGGEITVYPPSFQIQFHSGLWWMMSRLKEFERAIRA